ncbi:DHH family phosphoesterase [Deferrisoma camini]|uniref:DHH family phosphoesterase n=1 Tax=Deferrisoma camini TaxID=1035120 RepID=UPI00046D2D29|nr:DHH family phosphoesterase [Deferrisoma camini]
MAVAVISRTDFPALLLDPRANPEPMVFVTDDPALARMARRRGFRTATGELTDPRLFRRARIGPEDRVLFHLPRLTDLNRCLAALLKVVPDAAVAALLEPGRAAPRRWKERVLFIPTGQIGTVCLRSELEKAATRRMLAGIRSLFEGAEKVLLLVQDDPDPDGLASALALRALLGRNRLTAVIGAFGAVTRPENVAMVRLLDIQVETITPDDLERFDRIALLDVQPLHSPDIPLRVDLVIDHHPRRAQCRARISDIRPKYGATSTIMTEYLLASDTPISQRLATALIYGIKTDTQLLGRDTTPMDVSAFASLYPLANHALLRRIDRPQFPRRDLPSLSHALNHARIVDDILFAHLGPLTREDVVPFIADFGLEVEAVEWSVVSGIYGGKLVISVRSYGTGRSAGEVVKAAFESFGSAGGHKAMAKAVIPLDNVPDECVDHETWVQGRFLNALYQKAKTRCPDNGRAEGNGPARACS